MANDSVMTVYPDRDAYEITFRSYWHIASPQVIYDLFEKEQGLIFDRQGPERWTVALDE